MSNVAETGSESNLGSKTCFSVTKFLDEKHVLRIIRPYVCTHENCDQSEYQFKTIKDLLRHIIMKHELHGVRCTRADVHIRKRASVKCLFCGEQTAIGTGEASRGSHVGGHMEEIAFSVIPKAYEDWDFYPDSSFGGQYMDASSENGGRPPSSLFRDEENSRRRYSLMRRLLEDEHSGECNKVFFPLADPVPTMNDETRAERQAPDVCGYCGTEFANPPAQEDRWNHVSYKHSFQDSSCCCDLAKTNVFQAHVKSHHAGQTGPWTAKFQERCEY